MGDLNLSAAIERELLQYSEEIAAKIKKACTETANELRDTLEAAERPHRTGAYRKGWRVRKEFEDGANVRYRIYNKTHPWLTHLLENGHAKIGGGRVQGVPHIRPAEAKAGEALINRIKEAVEN